MGVAGVVRLCVARSTAGSNAGVDGGDGDKCSYIVRTAVAAIRILFFRFDKQANNADRGRPERASAHGYERAAQRHSQ